MKPIRILFTRKLSESGISNNEPFQNFEITEHSFITIRTDLSEEKKQLINKISEEQHTVIFTSSNAVNAVADILGKREKEEKISDTKWKIYSLAEKTREAVIDNFGLEKIKGNAANAKALAEQIVNDKCSQVIFFCGNKRRDELSEALGRAGITVHEIIVYKTILSPVKTNGNVEGIVFFSPSAAESFFSENTISENTVCFSIGSTTTASLKTYTENKIITSEQASEQKMMELILDYFRR